MGSMGQRAVSSVEREGIAVVTFSNPPVNALSVTQGIVSGLRDELQRVLADPNVIAVVVRSDGRLFSAGADISDFDASPERLDEVRSLMTDVIEAASKPIVMALHGQALGGGLELAMVGHYRICTPNAKFGLPEVTLGLLPGSGGTQRLPRLVGTPMALDMMLTGRQIAAREALAAGLIQEIADEDLMSAALVAARRLAGNPPTRVRELRVTHQADTAAPKLRKSLSRAPEYITQCVEAAELLPFSEGLALEAELFDRLLHSEAAKGLRHVFFGRRLVGRIPGLPETAIVRPIQHTSIIGAGLMGTGIAIALVNAGQKVVLIDQREAALEKARQTVDQTLQRDAAKGRISSEQAQSRLSSLSTATSLDALANADLVIEAVFEDMAIKQDVFKEIDRIARPDAILASNTSTLDVNAIAAQTSDPSRVLGVHFFSPANIMKLVEVVRGTATSPATLVSAMAFVRSIDKVGVVCGVCNGFIGNRMFEEMLRQAYFLLEEGALPIQVDSALEKWGMAMGPLKVMDLAGQDIGWSIRKRRKIEQPDRPYSPIPDQLCEMGRFGQKTGAGYYKYADGRTAQVDPVIESMIVEYSASQSIPRRVISDGEIVERCIFALINEGAKILDEGIAYRPVDIDMVWIFGYGFPSERGGPMFYADQYGVERVLARIQEFQSGRNSWAWQPSGLLTRMIEQRSSFAKLDSV